MYIYVCTVYTYSALCPEIVSLQFLLYNFYGYLDNSMIFGANISSQLPTDGAKMC